MAASLLCALSTSIEMLTVARVLQGLGGGGLMTLSQALIGEAIPPRERARYQGYLAGVSVSSSTFGPVVGGYLTQHFGWRSIFLVNCRSALPPSCWCCASSRPGDRRSTDVRRPGLVLFIAVRQPGPAGARAGATHERRHAAEIRGAAGARHRSRCWC